MKDRIARTHLTIVLIASVLVGVAVCKADVVLDWNEIAADTLTANGTNPFAGARYLSIVQLAVFEAVNSITGNYKPYLGLLLHPPEPRLMRPPLKPLMTCW